jgi:hypothetical protein
MSEYKKLIQSKKNETPIMQVGKDVITFNKKAIEHLRVNERSAINFLYNNEKIYLEIDNEGVPLKKNNKTYRINSKYISSFLCDYFQSWPSYNKTVKLMIMDPIIKDNIELFELQISVLHHLIII